MLKAKEWFGIDLSVNPNQAKLYTLIMEAVQDQHPYRYFLFGGAVRGGKTFACLTLVCVLAKMYPGSRWLIVRDTLANLKKTTFPSIRKVLANHSTHKWHRDPAETYIEFENQSVILFFAENFTIDKDLDRWKGLECNGILFEQLEEMQECTWHKGIERAGTWVIPGAPPPLLLATCNPTMNWVRNLFHEPYTAGTLQAPYFFIPSSPHTNPFLEERVKQSWQAMDTVSYQRFVEGNWLAYPKKDLFAYEFDKDKHTDIVQYNPKDSVYLSFDFNIDPGCCTIWQTDEKSFAYCIDEIRIFSCTLTKLADAIKERYPGAYYMVLGDASGHNRNILMDKNLSCYRVLENLLHLKPSQIQVPKSNPPISKSRIEVNTIFEHFADFKISPQCVYLLEDLTTVHVINDGRNLDKSNPNRGHLLDTLRYFVHRFFANFGFLKETNPNT